MKCQREFIILLIVTLGVGGVISSSADQADVILPYNKPSEVVIDGIVEQREYLGGFEDEHTGIQIHWEHDGELMYIAMVSPGTGWVAIGFGPEGQKMDKAPIIFGAVEDDSGEVRISDQLVTGRSHSEDDENNVVEYAGSQNGGETIIEFSFPLNSGDPADHSFEMGGTYGCIVAFHKTSDDFEDKHNERFAPISLQVGSPNPPATNTDLETTTPNPSTTTVSEFNFTSTSVFIIITLFSLAYITHNRTSKEF